VLLVIAVHNVVSGVSSSMPPCWRSLLRLSQGPMDRGPYTFVGTDRFTGQLRNPASGPDPLVIPDRAVWASHDPCPGAALGRTAWIFLIKSADRARGCR
jgi:hypothetical protein